MSFLRNCEAILISRFSFPFSNTLFNRRGILRKYKSLIRTCRLSSDELSSIQFDLLKQLLQHAHNHVPYYTRLFEKIDFDPNDFKQLEDIRHIPPLTKEDLIDNRLDLVDTRWRAAAEEASASQRTPGQPLPFALFRGKKLIRNTTSGSTGQPSAFYETGSITAANWANELRLRDWYGIAPGTREVRMARISIDQMQNSRTIAMRRFLWNQWQLPGVRLTEEDFAFTVEKISKFQPRVILGNTYSLMGLAEYLQSTTSDRLSVNPDLIISWAGPLYDHERVVLENVFQCPSTNIYGTREIGHIASQCQHRTMHIHQEDVYLESSHDDSDTTTPGELLATTLVPTPMPFIRYITGDLGILADSECPCGVNLKVIKELTGRVSEIFTTTDGQKIPPGFWCQVFMDVKQDAAIRQFQVVYQPNDRACIRIVKGPTYNEDIESFLKSRIRKDLGSKIQPNFEYLESIPLHPSGKCPIVLNETV